jgi:hypothetical protein
MRRVLVAILAMSCGNRPSAPVVQPSAAASVPATRWAPARPTYLFASSSLEGAQRSLRDAIDLVGALAGRDVHDAARAIADVIAVDALHGDPLAAIGIDLHASWAVFSEELSPTLVVHLTAPDQMAAFLDRQRERGLVTQSVIVDGTEVFSATLLGGATISWAIAGEWMWLHLAVSGRDDAARWFAASHASHAAGWTDNWVWAQGAASAAAGLVGFLDLHGAIANAMTRMPDAVACAKLIDSVGRVAVSLAGDERHFTARIVADVGSIAGVRAALLPPPSGWDATVAHAALAAQWNLDLAAARSWAAPCLATAGVPLAMLDDTGVRTARAVLLGFDPDAASGSGAVAFDLASAAFFERQLDRIPLRRTLERKRTFGGYQGYSIAIPFSVTIEYVLQPRLAMLAVGEGVLARVTDPGARGAPSTPPIFALDLAPPAMAPSAWEAILHVLGERLSGAGPSGATTRRVVEHLMAWREGHLAVTAEATGLVLMLSGTRR